MTELEKALMARSLQRAPKPLDLRTWADGWTWGFRAGVGATALMVIGWMIAGKVFDLL